MLTKTKVQELISHMPESFSVDELVEKIFLLQKIEIGQAQLNNGEGIEWEDMIKEMDSWFE